MVWGLHTLPQLFPTKVHRDQRRRRLSRQEIRRLDCRGGGTCKQGNKWLGIPVATIGGYMTYRKSAVDKAGFKEFPKDFPGFLELCKALKKNNTPAGFALGHASGDANAWMHWVLWSPRRLHGRQERQGHHQLARDREGARIRQGAVPTLSFPASRPGTTRRTTRRSWRASSTSPPTASRSTSPPRTTEARRTSPRT